LILIGAVFAAIGLFSSSLTDNQITAFVIGVFLGFLLYFVLSALASLLLYVLSLFIEEFSLSYHFQSMGRWVIDSSNLVYFLSLISTLLVATGIMIRRK